MRGTEYASSPAVCEDPLTEVFHVATSRSSARRICDYEGSDYRTRFWEGRGREYEDAVERLALRALLPPRGERLADVGAGYGRLVDLYRGYQQVILVDYARSQLLDARERLGDDPRFIFVAASAYHLPLADHALDAVVTVRLLHHLDDLGAAFGELARVLRPGGTYVLEHANKRHLKAILRYMLRRQKANPFDQTPYEFVPLNFDFHPAYVLRHLREAGFTIQARRAVSLFRLGALKRVLGPRVLTALESPLQSLLGPLAVSPSVFVGARRELCDGVSRPVASIWRCPACHATDLTSMAEGLSCHQCGAFWPLQDGIYDFRVEGE